MSQGENQKMQKTIFKARKFYLTFWHEVDIIEHQGLVYGCQCFDKCTEEHGGKFHGHAFLYFNNPIRFSTIKKWYGNDCHNEKPMSNSECINYIMNPEHEHGATKYNRIEIGEPPNDNGMHFNAKKALEMKDSEVLDLHPRDAAMVLNLKDKFKCDDIDIADIPKTVKVYYIYGPSGTGKTTKAFEILKNHGAGKISMGKFDGHFWAGIKNHKTKLLLIDDFRDSQMSAAEFINLIDYNKHTMRILNGNEINDYEVIVITSIQNPKHIYPNMRDKEPKIQWLRRMEIIKIDNNENKNSEDCETETSEDCEDIEI